MATEQQGAWHPDPFGGASWRWWDGGAWSARTAPAEPERSFDRPLRETPGAGLLTLHREDAGTDGVLRLGDASVGRIHKPGIGDGAAHCHEGSWAFRRPALQERADAFALPSGAFVARFQFGGGGFFSMPGRNGVISFGDGRTFAVRDTADLWGGPKGVLQQLESVAPADWTVVTQTGVALLRTDFGTSPKRSYHRWGASDLWAEVYPAAADSIELPLLLLLTTLMSWTYASSIEAKRNLRRLD